MEKYCGIKNVCMILQNDIEELNGFLLLENLTWITLFDRMMSEVPFQRKGIGIYLRESTMGKSFYKRMEKI